MPDDISVAVRKVIDQIPLLHAYLGDEVGLFVSDMDRYLVSQDGAVKLQIKVLDPVKPGSTARAGDLGRGFNVVAEEIRKLASRTQTSAKDVSEKLYSIKGKINALLENILQVSAVAEEQSATTQEVNSSVQKIEPVTEQLNQYAAGLLKACAGEYRNGIC